MPRARSQPGSRPAESAPAARRTLRVLELLAAAGTGLRMTDVAAALDLPKSSTTLLLTAITEMGWAERDPETGNYLIGVRAWQVGQHYLRAKSLADRAQPLLDAVRDELNETVRMAILDGRENIYIADSRGGQALALDTPIGSRLPAYATGLGKALLASLEPEEVRRRFDGATFETFTPRTLGDLESLLKDLAAIRRRGWSEDTEEYVQGVRCVAVPVRDHRDEVVAALSVSVPTFRFNREHRRAALAGLQQAATELSRALGAATTAIPSPPA